MTVAENSHISLKALESQRILFTATFAVGTIGVLVLRELGFGSAISSLYAVGVMIVYLVVCLRKSLLFRPSTLGDNLYYLGFLFTLVSLSYTLVRYNDRVDITFIIQNFGIAMATTLAGLLGRVALNQERDDPELYEHAVRMSLTDAAAHTIGETSKIRSDIHTLRTSIVQSINEGVGAAVAKLNEAAETSSKNLDNHLAGLFSELQQTLNRVAKNMTDEFDSRHSEIQQQTNGIWTQMQADVEKSSNIQSKLAEESKRFLTSLGKLNDSLASVKPIDEKLLESIVEPVQRLRAEIQSLGEALASSVGSVGGIRDSAESLSSDLSRVSMAFDTGFSQQLKVINDDLSGLSKNVTQLMDVISQLTEQMVTQSRELARLSELSNSGYEALVAGMRSSSAEAEANIKALQDSLVRVTDAVVDAVRGNERQ